MTTKTERRIYPPKDYEKTLEALTVQIFRTKQKALMFAAALGFHRGEALSMGQRGTDIRYDVFERAMDDGFIDALAVARTGDLKILAEDRLDERVTIFEEFAHAGLRELDRIWNLPSSPLEEIIELTQGARHPKPSDLPGLDPSVRGILETI